MALTGSRSSATGPTSRVVPLRGQYDCARLDDLVELLSSASALDDADLVVDLSDVTFVDASTLGALAGVGRDLRAQGRVLRLSATSGTARRLLDLCGMIRPLDAPTAAAP